MAGTIPTKEPHMSTFANQLKSEISRLAKKEVRAETQALKKASAQYRSEIAALKRRVAGLEAQIKKQGKGIARAKPAEMQMKNLAPHSDSVWRALLLCAKTEHQRCRDGQAAGRFCPERLSLGNGQNQAPGQPIGAIAAARKLGKRAVAAKLGEPAEA